MGRVAATDRAGPRAERVSVAKRHSRRTRPRRGREHAIARLLCVPRQPKPAGVPARNSSAPPEHLSTDSARLRPDAADGHDQQDVDGPHRDAHVVVAHTYFTRPPSVALRDPTDEASGRGAFTTGRKWIEKSPTNRQRPNSIADRGPRAPATSVGLRPRLCADGRPACATTDQIRSEME